MKNSILTFGLILTMGAFTLNTNAAPDQASPVINYCEGEHKCDDKCKKDKDGKCEKASADHKHADGEKACCKKGEKSCEGKKIKDSKDKKEEPKS